VLSGHRCGFPGLLRDGPVTTIVAGRRGLLARFGAEYAGAALEAQGRRLLAAGPSGADDDLVGDVTEAVTSLCARLYGRRAAASRAARGIAAVTGDAP
jgi:predicted site-specific integrase-resolvase